MDYQQMGSIPNLSIVKGPTRSLQNNSVHKLFEQLAKGTAAQNLALIFEENGNSKQYTYAELDQLANRLARVLTSAVAAGHLTGNTDGDYIVAVCMPPSDQLVITLLAILKAGAAYLPLDPTFPAARIEHIMREAKPVIVIYDNDSEHFVNTTKLSWDEFLAKSGDFSENSLTNEECLHHLRDDLAIVLYTSGSTGVPKGVRLPHKTILNRLQWQFKTFPYSKTETMGIFKTALTFVDSVSEIWGPLLNGLAIVVVSKQITTDPERLVELLERYKIERLVLVPSLLRSLLMYLELRKCKSSLENLKTWVCSGETLAVSLAAEFFKYFPENEFKLCNFYGSTEIMGDVTYHVITGPNQLAHQDKVPIGVPVDNIILYLLDGDYRPVKAGDAGELFVSGLNLAAGYVNGRDQDKFIENPLAIDPMFARLFRTGDFARIEKSALVFEGRTDSQVKIRGHRVDLSEVESAVSSIAGVDKAIVLCYKSGEINQALLAFVTTTPSGALLGENQIEGALRERLVSYMVPQVRLLDSVPLLVNGKIDRQALLRGYEDTNNNDDSCFQVDIDYTGVASSQMETAKVLFETVGAVLNRSARAAICLDANFYEIGGNSLNSIFTITSLNERGYHISISDFIAAIDLGEILERMTPSSAKENRHIISEPSAFNAELLRDDHKKDVISMVTTSFYQKADLEQWLMPDIAESDYTELLNELWSPLLAKRLSFIARTEGGKVVGVALNFDARDEPEVEIHSKLEVVFEYLESIEGPVRDNELPPGKNKVLHSFMMATHSSLSGKENVAVMKFMEDEVLKLARDRQFVGIFTTNTSPLTQQLGTDVYGYKIMFDSTVNTFIASDNTKPFAMAPNSQRSLVQWKVI